MALPIWNDTAADWPDHRRLRDSCEPLDHLVKNEAALTRQETVALMTGLRPINPSDYNTWTEIAYFGLHLFGDEPFDLLLLMMEIQAWRQGGGSDINVLHVRLHNIERDEYYPQSDGLVLVDDIWYGTGWPLPDFRFYELQAALTSTSTPWLPGTYLFALETMLPRVAGQGVFNHYAQTRGMLALMTRSL